MPAQTPEISVVMATFNRLDSVRRLLQELSAQTLSPSRFEVIVVDDGSKEPVAPALDASKFPFRLEVLTQANAGAAAARHRGIGAAKGELLVITDDDMMLPRHFLEAHLAAHPKGTRRAVLGRIRAAPHLGEMPFFERWYAHRLDHIAKEAIQGRLELTGMAVYTGNLSLHRADYLAVGGFDPALKRSEDAELGLKLEAAGVEITFSNDAYTLHGSDHTSEEVWLRRAFLYGVYDSRIRDKHGGTPKADPWRYLFRLKAPARPLLALAVLAPKASKPLSDLGLKAVRAVDKAGLSSLAYAGTAVVYSMEYFRGVREEAGSVGRALGDLRRFMHQRPRS